MALTPKPKREAKPKGPKNPKGPKAAPKVESSPKPAASASSTATKPTTPLKREFKPDSSRKFKPDSSRAFKPDSSRGLNKPSAQTPKPKPPVSASESPTMRSNPRKLTPDFSRMLNPNAREFKPARGFSVSREFAPNAARNAGFAAREAAEKQAAARGLAARAAGRAVLGRAASVALGPASLPITAAYIAGDAVKDTKPALAARDKVSGFLNRRTEYKQEQADKAAMEAARKRGEAKRDAGKPDYMSQVSASALKKFQDKELPEVSVTARKRLQVPVADLPEVKSSPVKQAPKATPAVSKPSAPRNYSKEASGKLGYSDDDNNAVAKKLRERAAMSAKERDEAPKFESQYADKLNKALGYAKGGHVKADGCARKGKTRGRII